METFPFTKKKLQQQPPARQHKLVSQWLKSIYLSLLEQDPSTTQLDSFKSDYDRVLQWLGESTFKWTFEYTGKQWIELVANQYHHHKKQSGIGLAEHNLLPKVQQGDDVSNLEWQPAIPYKVALDNIRSAFNVGSIFRTVDAAGWDSVLVGGTTPGHENQQVVKTAMGCTQWIPQESTDHLADILMKEKKAGYTVIGLETVEDSQNHLEFEWPEKGIVVLGNEEYGISQSTMQACDRFVHLPMQGKKNSVNVANAFAIISFHISFNSHQI